MMVITIEAEPLKFTTELYECSVHVHAGVYGYRFRIWPLSISMRWWFCASRGPSSTVFKSVAFSQSPPTATRCVLFVVAPWLSSVSYSSHVMIGSTRLGYKFCSRCLWWAEQEFTVTRSKTELRHFYLLHPSQVSIFFCQGRPCVWCSYSSDPYAYFPPVWVRAQFFNFPCSYFLIKPANYS